MNISGEKDVGSSVCRVAVKDPFVYFHVIQYLIYNILYDAAHGMTTTSMTTSARNGGVHCMFCLRVVFCRVYVQLHVENSAGSCKCTARIMCFNSHHIFIYAIRFSIFYRDCLFLPHIRRIHEALFLEKGKGEKKGGLKEEGEKDKEWKTAAGKQVSSTARDRYTFTLPPYTRHA